MVFAIPVAVGGEDLIQFQSLNLDRNLDAAIRALVDGFRSELSTENGQKRIIPYSPEYKPEAYEVEWVSADEQGISAVIDAIPTLASIPYAGAIEEAVGGARFYALVFEFPTGEKMVFMRRFERKKVMYPSRNLVIRMVGDRYSRLDEPTLQIDDSFDAVYYRGHVFSFSKNNFQFMFKFYGALRRYAGNVIQAVLERVPISNIEAFEASCLGNIHAMSKLRNIAKKDYFGRITMGDLKEVIAVNQLSVEIVADERGVERLVFDPRNRWEILNLLDDRYLESRMTRNRYEVNSKREIGK